jgi:hypothetical protein
MAEKNSHGLDQFRKLIATTELPELGPQRRGGTRAEAELERALTEFFRANNISSGIQPLLRSAALLWHDHLDASHTISQSIETPEGSWLHGIMHRREPDYGNAKYWFRRVGQHAAFPKLANHVTELLGGDDLAGRLIQNDEWLPFAFVDECERAARNPQRSRLLREIQAAEFAVLLEHIFALG